MFTQVAGMLYPSVCLYMHPRVFLQLYSWRIRRIKISKEINGFYLHYFISYQMNQFLSLNYLHSKKTECIKSIYSKH